MHKLSPTVSCKDVAIQSINYVFSHLINMLCGLGPLIPCYPYIVNAPTGKLWMSQILIQND